MKTKTIGILVCMFLFTTVLPLTIIENVRAVDFTMTIEDTIAMPNDVGHTIAKRTIRGNNKFLYIEGRCLCGRNTFEYKIHSDGFVSTANITGYSGLHINKRRVDCAKLKKTPDGMINYLMRYIEAEREREHREQLKTT